MALQAVYLKNRMTPCIRLFIMMCCTIIFTASCVTKQNVYLPVGRMRDSGNEVSIRIDELEKLNIPIIKDIHSGSWIKIPAASLHENSTITILIKKKNSSNTLKKNEPDLTLWLKPSVYIDCDHPDIIKKAGELTAGLPDDQTDAKIRALLDFVNKKIEFKLIRGLKKDFKKASESLKDGYGICMNKVRIFVALCRAGHIPARIICGSIISDDGKDHHHDWAEVYDEKNKKWFTLDPTMSNEMNINTLKYIDAIYNIDDNPMFPFTFWANDYAKIKAPDQKQPGFNNIGPGISIFFTDRKLQWETGAIGYTVVEDKSPEYISVKIEYTMKDYLPE